MSTPDEQLAAQLSKFYSDPLGYVMFVFPWAKYVPIQLVELQSPYKERYPNCKYGPDVWACEFLDELGEQIKARKFNGHDAVEPIQCATASGHGIGKSVLVAWLIKFIMDTRPYSKGTVTANTAEQLKTKTWAELGKWHKLSLTEHWFTYNSGRGAMNLCRVGGKEEWRCDAQTCREENSEAFAGQHAASATSFYIFDEASAVPDKIFEVREGGTTDGEPMVFDFGNPTRNSGKFFEECAGRFRHRYRVRCIDSRDVAITNKERIEQWRQDYGEDSDFFKVRVRGMFPSAGSCQFISTQSVEEAQARELYEDKYAPLIIGVDVARFGDNETVILPRIGYDARSWPAIRIQGADTVEVEGKVIETLRSFMNLGINCSGLFIDEGGVGGGVVDHLWAWGAIGINFGGSPGDKKTYRFRSDEMWGRMRDGMSKLCLPANNQKNGVDLKADLTQREFGYTLLGNKVHLETKKDMVARGVKSPDIADALALTFAQDVAPLVRPEGFGGPAPQIVESEYDPLEEHV